MKKFIYTLLTGGLFLTACMSGGKEPERKNSVIPEVDVVVAEGENIDNIIRIPGEVLPFEKVDLYAEISGRVRKIYFQEGKEVRKGELLLRIDTDILEAQRNQVKVDLDLAKKDEKRKRELLESKALSLELYEQAQSKLAALEAQLELLDVQIAKGSVYAPFSGVIGLRQVSEGAYLTTTTKISSIAQNKNVKIEFSVPEQYVALVESGQKIALTTAKDSTVYEAEVYAAEPMVDPVTRMLVIRAVLEGDQSLYPGSFVSVSYDLGKINNAIMVPAVAIVPVLKGQNVWVIKEGKALSVPVETGIRTKDRVQISGAVKVGDTIAVTGLLGMREGMDVKAKQK